ncbi:MAG: sialate O-acetylesterase [Opitutales bacterium]
MKFTRQILFSFYIIALTLSYQTLAGQSEEGKHLFILSGQSNMRQPLTTTFSKCVEGVFGENKVIVTTVAQAGQPIKRWHRNWQPPAGLEDSKPENNGGIYDRLISNVKKKIENQALASLTFIWMQGEADAKAGWGSVYEVSFHGVLDQFKEDLGIQQINFVVGRINDFWVDPEKFPDGELIRKIQVELGEENQNGRWINTDDINRGVNPWGGYSLNDGHFPPTAYRVMGQRFAKAACDLIVPNIELDTDLFREVFFDSAEDVKSHAAIGKPVFSSPEKSTRGQTPGLLILTDGKFGTSRHQEEEWLRIAPKEEPVEFIVDLGEVQKVDAVGVHTLFSSDADAEFPDSIVIQYSEDGETYQISNSRHNTIKLNEDNRNLIRKMANPSERLLLLTEQVAPRRLETGVSARYIKITVNTGKQWVLIDEIIVNPVLRS